MGMSGCMHLFVCMRSLEISMYNNMSSKNRCVFMSFSLMQMPFSSFSFLLAVASDSRAMLNSRGEHAFLSCLFPPLILGEII